MPRMSVGSRPARGVMRGRGPVWRDGKIVEETTYETTGAYVLVCTGLGKTIERAQQKVYRAVEGVRFADKIFRDDAGEKLTPAVLDKLHRFGYAVDMT